MLLSFQLDCGGDNPLEILVYIICGVLPSLRSINPQHPSHDVSMCTSSNFDVYFQQFLCVLFLLSNSFSFNTSAGVLPHVLLDETQDCKRLAWPSPHTVQSILNAQVTRYDERYQLRIYDVCLRFAQHLPLRAHFLRHNNTPRNARKTVTRT